MCWHQCLIRCQTWPASWGKPVPEVHLTSNHIVIKNQVTALLKNTFMHIFRNSLDHGIEVPEQRAQAGKSPNGNIYLETSVANGQLRFDYKDDGCGLALARIKQKSIDNGLIEADKDYPDNEIAMLIFHSGFSDSRNGQRDLRSGRGDGSGETVY